MDYRLTIRNEASWPVFLSVGPWADGYSMFIDMGSDSGAQLGQTVYLGVQASLELHFWRDGNSSGKQGWLALRAAYNPFSVAFEGAWQYFQFDNEGGFFKYEEASYPNTLGTQGWGGDTLFLTWTFSDAVDWPEGWSRTPLENPIELAYTNQYEPVWNDAGSGAIFNCTIYKPKLEGYFNLGFTTIGPAQEEPIGGIGARAALMARPLQPGVVVPPDSYRWIGDDHNSGAHLDCSWWTPVPPAGFVALGSAFVGSHDTPPERDAISCVREDLVAPGKSGKMVYSDRGSAASHDLEIFEVYPDSPGSLQVGASVVAGEYVFGSPPKFPHAVSALKPPARSDKSDALSPADVETIIAASGPTLVLHQFEDWMPISADRFVEAATRTGDYLSVDDPAIRHGNLSTAKAYVFAEYVCSQFTDLQFWFFYGYNGPTFVRIHLWVGSGVINLVDHVQDADNLNCGQHQGDWENITLRVDNRRKSVVAVGYTSHGDTEWYAAPAGRPRVYSALHMHGSYPFPGDWLELASWQERENDFGHMEVEVYSRNQCADSDKVLDCSTRYQIVGSNFLTGIVPPVWLGEAYRDVRWGPKVHEKDVITIKIGPISYDYVYETDEEGPSTPSFGVDAVGETAEAPAALVAEAAHAGEASAPVPHAEPGPSFRT